MNSENTNRGDTSEAFLRLERTPGRTWAVFENAFFENFANFWRARSRLYQNEILQENMRSTAFFKLYKICILLHRCNLKIFAKNCKGRGVEIARFLDVPFSLTALTEDTLFFSSFPLRLSAVLILVSIRDRVCSLVTSDADPPSGE